jgi:hypothetical protein
MSVTTITGPTSDDPLEELLNEARGRIDAAVIMVARHHYQTPTQEHQLTARLAQAIESELRHQPIEVDGLRLEVFTQDLPDRGSGSMESKVGADLYISLDRLDEYNSISKGMLVQSKWHDSLTHADERRRLRNQIARMYRRSSSSYLWVFDENGVTSIEAPKSSNPTLTWIRNPTSVGELIVSGFRCTKGDPNIGRDLDLSPAQALIRVLHRLSARHSLDLAVTHS